MTSRASGREIVFPEAKTSISLQEQAFLAAMALDFADKMNMKNPEDMQYILKSMFIFLDDELKHDHRRYLMDKYNIDMNADIPIKVSAELLKSDDIDINFFK